MEVRQTTPLQAAQWLLVQAFLALIRIGIWICDPTFDDFPMERDDPSQRVHLSEAQLVMLWYTQIYPNRQLMEKWRSEVSPHSTEVPIPRGKVYQMAACPPNWLPCPMPETLMIPTWAVAALDEATRDVSSMFDLARRLRKGGPTLEIDVDTFCSAELFWNMPGWIFMLWVDAHAKQNHLDEPDEGKRKWKAYSCRVIQDKARKFHFLPYWTSCRLYSSGGWESEVETNDRYQEKVQYIVDTDDDGNPARPDCMHQLEVFGDPGEPSRLIWSCNRIDQPDAALPHKQELVVGWHLGVQAPPCFQRRHLELFNDFMSGIEEHSNDMWRDLESIFARVDVQERHDRHSWMP